MLRYLAAIACLAVLGVAAAAVFADLRPDARLHPAPWVLTWKTGQAHTLRLTGEDGADLRMGSRALAVREIGTVDQAGEVDVLGSAEGCFERGYTVEDPGQTVWLPAGSAVEVELCSHRPDGANLTLGLFSRSEDSGSPVVTYTIVPTDTPPEITSPASGSSYTATADSEVVTVEAVDVDGDPISFFVSGGRGVFGIGLSDGVLYVDAGAPSGPYNLTVTAVAADASVSIEITVTVQ